MLLAPVTAPRIPVSRQPTELALPQPTVQPQDVRLFLEALASEPPTPLGGGTPAAIQSQGSSTKESHQPTSGTGVVAKRETLSSKRLSSI